ncbi:MAG: hypothetical protein CML73_02315 [Rhodobiaceae bacterium]|nr:hypothetical protein [Rhodobiaceae bacterium]|tara:strand:+ start:186 stop:590 length:405 start_codon:yes stop_codon:yes gene_type:complete
MSNYFAMSPGVMDFLGDFVDYSKFGTTGIQNNALEKIQANKSDLDVALAKINGEALQDITKYRTQAELELKVPKRSGFDKIMGGINSIAGIAGGLKGMGMFDNAAASNVAAGYSPGLGVPLDAYFGPGSYSGNG